MEFVIENYILRATEDGKIERYYEYKKRPRNFWKEIKGVKDRGYLKIKLYLTSGKRDFKVHRLVYFAHNQDWDIYDTTKVIDHDDRIKTNNKIGNLRLITTQQNAFNTNAKGYSFDKKSQKWRARIIFDGKIEYLGYYDTPEEAHQAYLAKKATLHTIP